MRFELAHFFEQFPVLCQDRNRERQSLRSAALNMYRPSIPFDIAYYSEPPRAVPIQNHKPAGAEYDNLSVFTAYGADVVIIR